MLHFVVPFELQAQPCVRPSPGVPADLHDLPVLVVDDNSTNRRLLTALLANWRMRPMAVEDGPAALSALLQATTDGRPFQLCLLDMRMPTMDGFTVVEQLKRTPVLADVPIVILTSTWQPCDALRARELGVCAYLPKPVRQAELLNAIRAALAMPADVAPTREPAGASRRLSILLAEDSLVNQRLAVHLLEQHGHTVTVASTGPAALAAPTRQRFDLILMDVQMPGMDGLEVTAAIRAREQETHDHVPIIAMTSHALSGDRERCLQAGMDGYLAKPIDAASLFATIESLVGAGTGSIGRVESVAATEGAPVPRSA
jgi:CheY-like chemotaxis protein